MLPRFYYHPRMLGYDFGPRHPLKPERLRRTIELLEALGQTEFLDPGLDARDNVLRVHDLEYVEAVALIGSGMAPSQGFESKFGFGSLDNPSFPGVYEASLAYSAGTAAAARDVLGGAPLAFNISGGLHHAHRNKASGFCVFDDPAIALHILRERFDRVAYVDIDLHHGDGVQWMFYDDPNVLTCSIHQEGSRFFPGTGWVEESGPVFTSVNAPLQSGTTGDVWLEAFELIVMDALRRFQPQAIVLQMGTDAHEYDPLGGLRLTAQEWLEAVQRVRDFGAPIVAVGGGGYCLTTVPRMWVAACLTLSGLEAPQNVPEPLGTRWGMPRFFDEDLPEPRGSGAAYARRAIDFYLNSVAGFIPNPH
ncbi:MAG: acetoin utilization protein AcuC [Chthonomonas sp.]